MASREDYIEGGGGNGRLGKVLSCSNTAIFQGGDVDVVGGNGTEAGRISCGVPATGYEVEGENAKGRFVAEVGSV